MSAATLGALAATKDPRAAAILLAEAQPGIPERIRLSALAGLAELKEPVERKHGRELVATVRAALGAGRARVLRQLLTESVLMSLQSGALGVLLAVWGVRVLVALEPGKLPRAGEVGVHPAALGFAAAITVLTAVGLGLVTALRATSDDVQESLKGSDIKNHRIW